MEAYADGDATAFSPLYDALAPRLYGFALRQLRDRGKAEELVQETMLSIHRARGSFRRGADVVPWAFAIARRLSIDGLRRYQLELATLEEDECQLSGFVAETPADADQWLFAKELAVRLEAELRTLPESQRVAFELLRREGLSHVQAAEALGTTVNSVKLRAHRAYERLKTALRPGDSK